MPPFLVLFCLVIVAAGGWLSPALCLALGVVFAFLFAHPFRAEGQRLTKFLLQAAVVLLGFGMNLRAILEAGRGGLSSTAISNVFVLGLGLVLGRVMRVPPRASLLIAAGTAICGGSAIAAIGPVAEAGEDEMAVALGAVFSLNAVALVLFPVLGHAFGLSESQFGLWAALAIHDTSSVVGAAAKFGPKALEVGTTVKLVRSLWIVPLALAVASLRRRGAAQPDRRGKIAWPWFVLLFVMAAGVRSLLPREQALWTGLSGLGRNALNVVLLLIGASLSPALLKRVGWRPMVEGVLLWIAVGSASLWAIRAGWLRV